MHNKLEKNFMAKLAGPGKRPRRSLRHRLPLDIIKINGKSGGNAALRDISANGAKLELPFAPPLNSTLEFPLALPKGPNLNLVGKVLWVRPLLGDTGRFFAGLQFFRFYWEIDHWLRNSGLPVQE